MHFDDRLATVLRLPITGGAMARIQFRQLIDLLGARDGATDGEGEPNATLDAAFARLDDLGAAIPATERAAILREPSVRLARPELVARLTALEPEVASAAVTAADLSEAEWFALIPLLPVRARGILRHRAGFGPRVEALLDRLGIGDRGLPPVTAQAEDIAAPAAPERVARPELVLLEGGAASTPRAISTPRPEPISEGNGFGAIVQRIEAFRQARETPHDADTPQQPLGDALARSAILAFDFTTDAQGRVNWADGPLAPGLVGYQLAAHDGTADSLLGQAMQYRQPLSEAELALPGAEMLGGMWRLDALPLFDGPDGRFVGYAGRLRRAAAQAQAADDGPGDTMRQVLHELRTPANAIQIAAEIIQQQLYGPAPHEYRALAAAIAGDTAQVLAGFDELDRLVRLESGDLVPASGDCDLGSIVSDTVARLRSWTGPRGSGFALSQPAPYLAVRMEREEAQRLVWRLLAALAGATAPGEILDLGFDERADAPVFSIALPQSLADRMDQPRALGLPSEPVRSLSAGMFGIGFTLRLATAEAEAAGGMLHCENGRLWLALPGLTHAATGHTQA